MMPINYRNEAFNANGTIDCEVEHPVYGWIPFTASPDDPEKYGRDLFYEMKPIAKAYVEPEPSPAPVPRAVSRFQLLAALSDAGLLADAKAAASNAPQRVRLAFENAFELPRSSNLIVELGNALGLTSEQMDDIYRTAIQIEA